MMNPTDGLAREIIGLGARIVESTDPTLEGIRGLIVLETKNMISVRTDSSIKQISKKAAQKIELETLSGVCFISGSSLVGRSEDRKSLL